MNKKIVVFLASLAVLVLIIGCPPAEQKTAEPAKVKPAMPEPAKPETPQTKPPRTKPHPASSFHDKAIDILTNFIDEKGMVDYRALKLKRLELKNLLDEFDKLSPKEYNSWTKKDKIALWLNVYNIQMLKIIIDNYPIQSARILRVLWPPNSIRHIPPSTVIGASKWDNYKFMVMDEQFTLSEIERRFFHKQFDEPRVFLALSHASLSGPPLRNEPYYGYKLNKQLDDQVKKFLSNPNAFRIDRKRQTVYISAIFQPNWYGSAFINKFGTDKKFKDHETTVRAVLNFITNYTPKYDTSFLEVKNYNVKYIPYDWRINE